MPTPRSEMIENTVKRTGCAIVAALTVVAGCASPPAVPSGEQESVAGRHLGPEQLQELVDEPETTAELSDSFSEVFRGDYPVQVGSMEPSSTGPPAPMPDAAPLETGAPVQRVTYSDPLQLATDANGLPVPTGTTSAESVVPAQQAARRLETGTPQPVEYFVGMALAQHPAVAAARQRVAAEINRVPQVLALPDPKFNNVFWPVNDQALQTAAGRVGNQMSVSQAIPWPEKLRSRGRVVRHEVRMAQAEVEQVEREVVESVKLAYYELWFATRAIEIVDETSDWVEDLVAVTEARYRGGATQQDVLRARLEVDRLHDQRVRLTKQKQMAQADLAALVQQPVTLIPEAIDDPDLANVAGRLDDLIGLAERCNPKLAGLASEMAGDRERQRLACLQRYPDLQVGVHWGLVSDDSRVLSGVANGHDQFSFNVGTTLPIWRKKNAAAVREASHRTGDSSLRLQAERDSLRGTIRRLVAQADAFAEQRDLYATRIIPRSEDTLKLAFADYRGKRADFFSLTETYRERLMFETQLARIDATLAGTIAQIERAVGCPIP